MDEITKVTNSFSTKFIKMPQIWLRDCIEFFKQQGGTAANYTQDDLEQFVYMQWLLFDIRVDNIPVLPLAIMEEKKYELKCTITLQLLSIIDISRSKYSQIQKIRYKLEKPLESDVKELEFKGDSKRCLQLTLTDGAQEVQAFEYKPMSNLNLNLKPGLKIRFNSPLIIRYGQIMLQNENDILLLGGEVEEILVTNAPENILARALNLPLNNNPMGNIQQSAVANNVQPKNRKNIMNNFLNKVNPPPKPTNKVKTITEDDELDMLLEIENELNMVPNTRHQSTKPNIIRKETKSTNIQNQQYEEDIDNMLKLEDEIMRDEALNALKVKMDVNISNQSKPNVSKKSSNTKDVIPQKDMDISFGISRDLKSKITTRKIKSNNTEDIANIAKKYETIEILSSPDNSPQKKNNPNRNPIPSTSRQTFDNINEPTKSNIIPKTSPTKPLQRSPAKNNPTKCIAVNTLSKTLITTGKFKVNAKFKKVIDKLSRKDGQWYIKLQIEDSSGTLDLIVDYVLVDKLMGYTYEDLRIKNVQKRVKEFQEVLDNFKVKLQSLEGILEIAFVNKIPRLINIL